MGFSEIYEEFIEDIKATAHGQYVPGLDYDDVVAEMVGCLWKAWNTYVEGATTVGGYWWSVWQNRKRDLTIAANRDKRPVHVLLGSMSEDGDMLIQPPSYRDRHWPDPPRGTDEVGRRVWDRIAMGEPRAKVIEGLGISRRRYYKILDEWRSADVRQNLSDPF